MNRFALGAITACLFTTKEGREIMEKTTKIAVKGGSKLIKDKMGIDVKSILDEPKEEEVKSNEKE